MQGVWELCPTEAIGFFVILTPKSYLMQDLEHIEVNMCDSSSDLPMTSLITTYYNTLDSS